MGAGTSPAGVSPAGASTPVSATPPASVVFPDPKTGLALQGRFLNPVTKDYVYTAQGVAQGQGAVPAMVTLALTTAFGSSAVRTLGQQFGTLTEKGAGFQRQVATIAASALGDLVKRGLVQLLDIIVDNAPSHPDGSTCLISWRDLTTNTEHSNRI